MKVDAVILANGEYPAAAPPLQILADAPYVICCDGGADEYIRNGHIPNLIIGDGDSISEENRKKYGYLLHRISEQDTNDQTKAVNYLLSQGKRRIAIVGATGKREDHTLGNISLLMDYMPAGRGSKYPSSTSMPATCMGLVWCILSATSPTGGRALSTNVPGQNLRLRLKGSIWSF